MGEAAVKEPSMEDILSSIRKIISEEGNAPAVKQPASSAEAPQEDAPRAMVDEPAPQMSDVLAQVRSATNEPEPTVSSAAPDETSGNEAAKMAASLASIAESVKAEPIPEPIVEAPVEQVAEEVAPAQSVWDDVSETDAEEPVMEMSAPEEPEMEVPAPVATDTVPSLASIAESVVEQVEVPEAVVPEPEMHVEMAEATPAPEPVKEVEAPVSAAAVETIVEEEIAFKGALMSPSADNAVASSIDRLKRSAMDDLDAKTEAILRPMLREWLDENLPNMVERLVREEIERVARGV